MNYFVNQYHIIIVLLFSVWLVRNNNNNTFLFVTSLIPVHHQQRTTTSSSFWFKAKTIVSSSCYQKSKFATLFSSKTRTSSSKAATTTTTVLFQEPLGFFQDFFKTKSKQSTTSTSTTNNRRKLTLYEKEQILELKQSIVFTCDESTVDRSTLETLLEEISILSPIVKPSYSSELNKKWIVLYTTEKEINFFLNNNLASSVDQTIDTVTQTISNRIPFTFAGSSGSSGLYVDGTISPAIKTDNNNDEFIEGIRTNFQFTSARLEIGIIKLQIPPIGKGWFDTIYLDDDFRIDVNSRNDILICVPSSD